MKIAIYITFFVSMIAIGLSLKSINKVNNLTDTNLPTTTYYYDIDYVDDMVVCVLLITELGDEVCYLDTRFGTYPQSVRDSFYNAIETQCGQTSIYDASLRYNELIDAWLQEHKQAQLKLP